MKYTKQDKILMNAFVQAQKDIEHFYLQALREKNLKKAKYYAEKAKLVVQELQEEYQDWALTRWAEEYLKGFKQIEHLKRGTPQREQKLDTNKIFLQVGKVHKEAVLALVQSGNRAVFATLDGMKRDITYWLALFSSKGREIWLQHEIQSKLGAGLLTGKGLHYQKSDLVAFFQKKGLQLRDRSWRKWDPHTYAEMLIRTETARAYNAGMINRAIQLGTTKFRVVESWNCCDICAQYNGKIVDINKWGYELPPYHPNCRGTIEPVWEEDWREVRIPNDQIGNHLLFDLWAVEKKYWWRESRIWTVNEAVLRNYSWQGFASLNHNLRFWKLLSEEEKFKQETLDKLFKQLSHPYEKVYRGVNLDIESYNAILKTKQYTDKAFMSSSSDIRVAKDFMRGNWKSVLFEIRNIKWIPLKEYSSNPLEDEILLPRDSTYKVKEIKNTWKYLYVIIE